MELAYQKLIKEKNLTIDELPEDAKTGIKAIQQIVHSISMVEKRGGKVSDEISNKLRLNDKWMVREILDYCENKNTNAPVMPNKPEEIIAEIKNQEIGLQIEESLKSLHEQKITSITLQELKSKSPDVYHTIFNTYEKDKENGVETSKYSLLEDKNNPQTFILNQK